MKGVGRSATGKGAAVLAFSGLLAIAASGSGTVPPRQTAPAGAGVGSVWRRDQRCRRLVVELQAAARQSVRRRTTERLDVLLEALPSGWVVRVVPHVGPAPVPDWAAIASPPYRSVNPLLISTDFAFRAQDAIGWNPRQFHFAADRTMYEAFEPVSRSISRAARPSSADEAALGRLVARAPEGTIEILDARLVQGTADQSRAAAAVSSHFSETAHTLDQPGTGAQGGVLGQIRAVSLRISLDLPKGSGAVPAAGTREVPVPCLAR